MEWADFFMRLVTNVGFPTAVCVALGMGLHYWVGRVWRDAAIPIVAAVVNTLQTSRDCHRQMTEQLTRAVDALDRIASRP